MFYSLTLGEELHNLALEVIELIKGVAGKEVFADAYSQVLLAAQNKRLKRKAQYALEVSVNPRYKIWQLLCYIHAPTCIHVCFIFVGIYIVFRFLNFRFEKISSFWTCGHCCTCALKSFISINFRQHMAY